MKTCSKCLIKKGFSEFFNSKASKDGKRPECKECNKAYYQNQENSYFNEYYKENKAKIREHRKNTYKKNPAKYSQRSAKYNKENKEKVIAQKMKYIKERRQKDPIFKLKCNIRSLIGGSLSSKGFKKSCKTAQILGCSFEELQDHLRSTFEINYGIPLSHVDIKLLHIDHIIPLASANTEEEVLNLNHHTNLQYLFYWDNIAKGNNMLTSQDTCVNIRHS